MKRWALTVCLLSVLLSSYQIGIFIRLNQDMLEHEALRLLVVGAVLFGLVCYPLAGLIESAIDKE